MKRNLYALLAGGLFGAGLFTSGMTDTAKVQGWLDLFGAWDPTLAFVLTGAILPMALAWRIGRRREVALLGDPIPASGDARVSLNLVTGSFIFGAGWGLAGLCPGPAVASLSYNGVGGIVFLAAMATGMLLATRVKPVVERLEAGTLTERAGHGLETGRA